MSLHDLLPAVGPVFAEFDRLEIVYYVGGSVASSLYGEPRSTLDIDIGADVPESAISELVSKWHADFYVSETAMREAVQRGKCFNLIHLKTMLKIDIFVCGTDAFNASVLKKSPHPLPTRPGRGGRRRKSIPRFTEFEPSPISISFL